MAEEFVVRDQFFKANVRSVLARLLVDAHPRLLQLLGRIQLMGVHQEKFVQGDLAVGNRIGAFADAKVVDGPHPKVTTSQGAHRWTGRHVFIFRLRDEIRPFLHLWKVGHAFGKMRSEVLHVDVGGMDRVETLLDQRSTSLMPPGSNSPGRRVGSFVGNRCDLDAKFRCSRFAYSPMEFHPLLRFPLLHA